MIKIPEDIVKRSIKWGLITGLIMAIYVAILYLTGNGNSIGLKFSKYIALLLIMGYVIDRFIKDPRTKKLYPEGIIIGIITSVICAFAFILMYAAASLVLPGIEMTKFNLVAHAPMDFVVVGGTLFFEILVFGLIATFICMQWLKWRVPRT